MKTKNLVGLALGIASLGLIASGGCGARNSKAVTYAYVVDYSGSNLDQMPRQLGVILADLDEAPAGSHVVVYRMGSSTEEVFSGGTDDDSIDGLVLALKTSVAKSDPVKGTNFAKMASALRSMMKASHQATIRIRVLTDGGDDFASDPKTKSAYAEAAGVVASAKRLDSIVFYGVKPGFRESIREAFHSADDRLQILGDYQVSR